jgi:hypothetical protein
MKRRYFITSATAISTLSLAGCSIFNGNGDTPTRKDLPDTYPDGFSEDGLNTDLILDSYQEKLTNKDPLTITLQRETPDRTEVFTGIRDGDMYKYRVTVNDTLVQAAIQDGATVYKKFGDESPTYSVEDPSEIPFTELTQMAALRTMLVETEFSADYMNQNDEIVYTIESVTDIDELTNLFRQNSIEGDLTGTLTVDTTGLITNIQMTISDYTIEYTLEETGTIGSEWIGNAQEADPKVSVRTRSNINAISVSTGSNPIKAGSNIMIIDSTDTIYEVQLTSSVPSDSEVYLSFSGETLTYTINTVPNPIGDKLTNLPYTVIVFNPDGSELGSFTAEGL